MLLDFSPKALALGVGLIAYGAVLNLLGWFWNGWHSTLLSFLP